MERRGEGDRERGRDRENTMSSLAQSFRLDIFDMNNLRL